MTAAGRCSVWRKERNRPASRRCPLSMQLGTFRVEAEPHAGSPAGPSECWTDVRLCTDGRIRLSFPPSKYRRPGQRVMTADLTWGVFQREAVTLRSRPCARGGTPRRLLINGVSEY